MQEVIIASNNANKVREIKQILGHKFRFYTMAEKGIHVEVEEDGETFFDNAYKKAKTIAEMTGMIAIGDDSGLEVDALDGAPGVYSARFAGEPCVDANNNAKLLKLMENETNRDARFISVVVMAYPDGRMVSGIGRAEGTILYEGRGTGGFGYDPLFLSKELGLTFAEATAEQKNTISHRARALWSLADNLRVD